MSWERLCCTCLLAHTCHAALYPAFQLQGHLVCPSVVRNRCLLVAATLLMLTPLALQGLGVSEEAVLQLAPNTNPFIAQGSLSELTAGQGEPGPILAAGGAKLQPPHVTRLPHRYPLGRGGHVEVGLNMSQAPQCSQAQTRLHPQ